jgi:hypothetical protein
VALVLKRAAAAAGLPTDDLSGHSLRAGFVTEAKKHGADDAAIMDQTLAAGTMCLSYHDAREMAPASSNSDHWQFPRIGFRHTTGFLRYSASSSKMRLIRSSASRATASPPKAASQYFLRA